MSKILLFGDICPTVDYRPLFNKGVVFSDEILSDIESADLVLGNLECPATNSNRAITKTGPNLKAKPEDLKMLAGIGFDAFSLANNHIMDYGASGVDETIATLNINGLKHFGAGPNINEAGKALVCNVQRKKVGFLSFAEHEFNLASENTSGANYFDVLESFEAIRQIKVEVDYLIVLYHGGIEYYQFPSPVVQKKCRKMIDFGADLVSIQHSHCIGTIERHHNGLIVYGQGNSVFGVRENSSWNEGLVISVNLESVEIEFKPIIATKHGIDYAEVPTKNRILSELFRRSEKVSDSEWIKKSWINFCQDRKSLTLPQLYGRGKWFNRLNRLLKNKLIDLLYPNSVKMVTLNLLRCEAHHEVMCTILGEEVSDKKYS